VLERLLALPWIIAIASVQEPGRPLVQLALHRHRVGVEPQALRGAASEASDRLAKYRFRGSNPSVSLWFRMR
jgi:hypothetical protein